MGAPARNLLPVLECVEIDLAWDDSQVAELAEDELELLDLESDDDGIIVDLQWDVPTPSPATDGNPFLDPTSLLGRSAFEPLGAMRDRASEVTVEVTAEWLAPEGADFDDTVDERGFRPELCEEPQPGGSVPEQSGTYPVAQVGRAADELLDNPTVDIDDFLSDDEPWAQDPDQEQADGGCLPQFTLTEVESYDLPVDPLPEDETSELAVEPPVGPRLPSFSLVDLASPPRALPPLRLPRFELPRADLPSHEVLLGLARARVFHRACRPF